MLPKEIVDILIKYQKDLEHSVFEINYSINEINNATHNIFASLKQVQMSLGYYLNNSVTKNIVHDNENEILNDLKTLRTYINSIESFRICKTQQEQENFLSTYQEHHIRYILYKIIYVRIAMKNFSLIQLNIKEKRITFYMKNPLIGIFVKCVIKNSQLLMK